MKSLQVVEGLVYRQLWAIGLSTDRFSLSSTSRQLLRNPRPTALPEMRSEHPKPYKP